VKKFNLSEADPKTDPEDPPGFQAAMDRFGPAIGAKGIGGSVYELPPGQALCPYHYEVNEEEWLIVLSGTPSVRDPEGVHEMSEGDITCFVPGPEGAHQILNASDAPARFIMISTIQTPAVCVYPDSDKIAVFVAGGADNVIVKRSSDVDYYEGESYP
jgi:uncharacterized cupin superfamily protein